MNSKQILIAIATLVPFAGLHAVTVSTPTLIDLTISNEVTNVPVHYVDTSITYGWVDWSGGTASAPNVKASGGATISAVGANIGSVTTWSDNRIATSWSGTTDQTAWGFNSTGFRTNSTVNITFGIAAAGVYELYLNTRANTPSADFLQFSYLTNVSGLTPTDLVNAKALGFDNTGQTTLVAEAYFKFIFDVTQQDIDAGVTSLGVHASNIAASNQVLGFGDAYIMYTAVPEPSTYGAIAGIVALVGAVALRRRKVK